MELALKDYDRFWTIVNGFVTKEKVVRFYRQGYSIECLHFILYLSMGDVL